MNNAVAASRVSAGKAAAARGRRAFDWIEANLGVERAVVAGIWGMESNFGAGMGSSDVLRSTASLAFRQVRGDFYRREFVAALQILEEGHITRERLVGSWAGAMGQPQFLPSSFLKYAVDADGTAARTSGAPPPMRSPPPPTTWGRRLAERPAVGLRGRAARCLRLGLRRPAGAP